MEQWKEITLLLALAVLVAGVFFFLYQNQQQNTKISGLNSELRDANMEINRIELKLVNSTPTSDVNQLKDKIAGLEEELASIKEDRATTSQIAEVKPSGPQEPLIKESYNDTKNFIVYKPKPRSDKNEGYVTYNGPSRRVNYTGARR